MAASGSERLFGPGGGLDRRRASSVDLANQFANRLAEGLIRLPCSIAPWAPSHRQRLAIRLRMPRVALRL